MKKIILQGISLKGKNRVRENGPIWSVLSETDKILFDPRPGPWLWIVPVGKDHITHGRWIREVEDKDFKIIGQDT
jgi:hypothetical protein